MIELLAPAGNAEAFAAALNSGADAVYLGGRQFGARAYAANFSDEELAAAVRNAHLLGVAVYVTVNTLVDNSEIPALADYLRHLYEIGVDAAIVQDIGVVAVARRVVPDLPLHASTQMTVHNLAGVEFLAGQGISRVVLARELSLDAIRRICERSPIEIETFIHGALCISYSGQCLMSSMIGGRSGNRGRCAQPCRLPYTLVDETGKDVLAGQDAGKYLLSPKDFNTIEHIPDLIDAGVVSFKIEGRMKRAEYVSVVVDSYRRAIDACLADRSGFAVPEQDQKDMAQIFNRGFTSAYLFGKQGREMMSDRRPNNRGVRIGRVIGYDPRKKTAQIKLDEPLAVGDIVEFWVKVGGRSSATVTSITVDGRTVDAAPPLTAATIPVEGPVRAGDRVFKTFDAALMEKARASFSSAGPLRRVPVDAVVTVGEGRPLTVTLTDEAGNSGRGRTSFLAEKAIKRPLSEETLIAQIGRLGTTVFALHGLDSRIEGEVMVPLSELNEARREAVEELEAARLARYSRPPLAAAVPDLAAFMPAPRRDNPRKPALTVNTDTFDKAAAAAANGADIIMFGGDSLSGRPPTADDYRRVVALARDRGLAVILSTPRLVQDWQWPALEADLELFRGLAPDAVAMANLGTLQRASKVPGLAIHGDWPLNIYNSAAIRFYAARGLASLTLSPELTFGQVEELAAEPDIAIECIAHGYLTLMISEYCVMGSFLGGLHTGACTKPCLKGRYLLKDRMGETFPVAGDQFCRMHILNAKELSMLPHVPRLARSGAARIRVEGKAATVDELARTTRLYRELLDQGEGHPLLAGDGIKTVEHQDITRGHYFRGVL
jgi:putative protease